MTGTSKAYCSRPARLLGRVLLGRVLLGWVLLGWVLLGRAHAQGDETTPPDTQSPPPETTPPETTPPETTPPEATDTAPARAENSTGDQDIRDTGKAPRPGQAHGVAVPAATRLESKLIWIPRALLFVPRLGAQIILSPARGSFWLYERYKLRERFNDVFFNEEGTFGVYPTALFETGFGLNAGVRLVHRDLLGAGEQLRIRVGYGGRFRQEYSASFDTGQRWSRLELGLEGRFDIRQKDPFYGIGNGDEVELSDVAMPVDALTDDTAIFSRFGQQVAYAIGSAKLRFTEHTAAKLSGGSIVRAFDPAKQFASGSDISDSYRADSLIGLEQGTSNVFTELELSYDSRRQASIFSYPSVDTTGWLLSGRAGYTWGLGDDPSAFVRYGLDVQRFFNLSHGRRALLLRVLIEGVTGDLERTPFMELPRLGGKHLLRGYPSGRFRDRTFTLGQAEYMWELQPLVSSFLFVDTGRAWRSLADVEANGGTNGWRVGFGLGLQFQTRSSFLGRLQLASSRDGSLFIHFTFDPVHDVRTRIIK